MKYVLAGIITVEDCELILTCGPHLPGTVPFTGSVAALRHGQDLLMHYYSAKVRNNVSKFQMAEITRYTTGTIFREFYL